METGRYLLTYMFEFIGEFENKSVKKSDSNFLFIRNVYEAWSGDTIKLAKMVLLEMCGNVDKHYTCAV